MVGALSGPQDLTQDWLSAALGKPIHDLKNTKLAVGESSQNIRCSFKDEQGKAQSVVVKLAIEDEGNRKFAIENGYYDHEVKFYNEFGNKLDTVPSVYYTILDEKTGLFAIVMEDFPECKQIDNRDRIGPEGAKKILSTLAKTQGPMLGDWMWAGQIKWLHGGSIYNGAFSKKMFQTFLKKYPKLPPDQVELFQWFVNIAEDWEKAVIPPLGLCHNDFRLDQVLFNPDGSVIILDWATVSWGPAFRDVAYFMGSSLSEETWKSHGRELFEYYLDELDANSEIAIKRDAAWRAFCSQTLHILNVLIGALGALELSERGSQLGYEMLATGAHLIMNVDAQKIVQEDIERASKPLEPAIEDDNLHPVAPGPRFNESWYQDVHGKDTTIYYRYGRKPNLDLASIYVSIQKEGHPLYQFESEELPLPPADNKLAEIKTENLWWKQTVVSPMKELRVQLKGKLKAFKNSVAVLWHQPATGEVDIELDITWKNVGKAMMWRITPRWECPSNAEGTYSIAGEQFSIKGPGQRDVSRSISLLYLQNLISDQHSWGMRDWWLVNGTWGNLHFEDGTRVQFQGEWEYDSFCQGYTQNLHDDKSLVEHTKTHTIYDWELDGRLKRATIQLQPGDLEIYAEPLHQGGHRLLGPEGRTLVWPRMRVKLTTNKGVKGIGLIEQMFVSNRGPPAAAKKVNLSVKAKL